MASRDFDLKLLVALRALLEEANVTRAGERIRLGQSSMSTALLKLRGQFNDELLVRVGREYELTPLAKELLPQVQRTLAEIERALSSDGDFDSGTSTRVFTIMCSDYATVMMRDVLAPVLRDHPGIGFHFALLPDQPTDSERDLMRHDFVVILPGIGIEGEGMELFRDHYVCLVDQNNPALVDGAISQEAFATLPHAVSDFGKAHVPPPLRRLRELGVHSHPAVTTSGLLALPQVVSGSEMLALVPSRLAELAGPATGTIGVALPFGELEIVEVLFWHASHEDDPGHRWLREQIAGHLGTLDQRGQTV